MTDLTLTCRRILKASPETACNARLTPATMQCFMAGGKDLKVIKD